MLYTLFIKPVHSSDAAEATFDVIQMADKGVGISHANSPDGLYLVKTSRPGPAWKSSLNLAGCYVLIDNRKVTIIQKSDVEAILAL